MIKSYLVIAFVFLLCAVPARAEYPQGCLAGYITSGLMWKEIPLLDKPGGKQVGTAKAVEDLDYCLEPQTYKGEPIPYEQTDVCGLKCTNPTYYEIKGSFARILANGIEGGVWIDMKYSLATDEEARLSFRPMRWMDDLRSYSLWKVWGYHAYELRETPSTEGRVLLKLDAGKHVITAFPDASGSWAEAVVYEVSKMPLGCYSLENVKRVWTKKQWKGWIKVFDDNGQPHEIGWGGIC